MRAFNSRARIVRRSLSFRDEIELDRHQFQFPAIVRIVSPRILVSYAGTEMKIRNSMIESHAVTRILEYYYDNTIIDYAAIMLKPLQFGINETRYKRTSFPVYQLLQHLVVYFIYHVSRIDRDISVDSSCRHCSRQSREDSRGSVEGI